MSVRVVFWSHWHPNPNGTDYWDVLGIYPSLESEDLARAEQDAHDEAMNRLARKNMA